MNDTIAAPAPSSHRTPVAVLRLALPCRPVSLRLKLEGESAYGSVKVRTARALLASLERAGSLRPGGHVVESTSGNLGIALAGLCAERRYRCTLMIDDATPAFSRQRMVELGAEVIHVQAPDQVHSVHARIEAVRALRAAHPEVAWTDQYRNAAGPQIHAHTTGPELLQPAHLGTPDAVAVPVSTGGTLAGVAQFLRQHAPTVHIAAVDAVGSAATGGPVAVRPGKLPGFGSGLVSELLTADDWDSVVRIADADAAYACRVVRARTGLLLGGSAGAAVVAGVRLALSDPAVNDIACLCPDGGDRYLTTIYAQASGAAAASCNAAPALAALAGLTLEGRHI